MAVEVFDSKVKSDFSIIEQQLAESLFGICLLDQKTLQAQSPQEFYQEAFCQDGSYNYKFGIWLKYEETTTFRAESHAVSDASKWLCVMDGLLVRNKAHSEMACTQI